MIFRMPVENIPCSVPTFDSLPCTLSCVYVHQIMLLARTFELEREREGGREKLMLLEKRETKRQLGSAGKLLHSILISSAIVVVPP